MSEKLDLSTLTSRPPWRVVKIIRWLAIGCVVLSIVLGLVAAVLGYMDSSVLGTHDETSASAILPLGELASELAWEVIAFAIYAFFLWLIALGVDKIDQLVWLKASEEDRLHIYNQRHKKKQK